jgi:hypothetical protein
MAEVLAIDSDWDIFTKYAYAFRKDLVYSLPAFAGPNPQHRLISLQGSQANFNDVNQAITANKNIKFITGSGHGLYEEFHGQNDVVIWKSKQTTLPTHVKDRIIHLTSCCAGAILSQDILGDGGLAFWGYSAPFLFRRERHKPAQLDQDQLAKPFFEMDALIDEGILAGQTGIGTHDDVKAFFKSNYANLMNANLAVSAGNLMDNYAHLVWPGMSMGDESKTI